MTTAFRRFPAGDLLVSDAERDRALADLSDHYQTGRLSAEEFDDRSGRALRARTGRELASLFTDLPRDQTTWVDPSAAAGWSGQRVPPDRFRPGRVAWPAAGNVAPIIGAVAGIAIAALIFGPLTLSHWRGHLAGLVVPLIVVLLIVRRLARGRR